jgi:hypothetical protein
VDHVKRRYTVNAKLWVSDIGGREGEVFFMILSILIFVVLTMALLEDSSLLGCHAMLTGKLLLAFQKRPVPSSS